MTQDSPKSRPMRRTPVNVVQGWIKNWLTPKSALGEYEVRVRLCLFTVALLWALAFASTFLIFHNAWTLVSMPTALAVMGLCLAVTLALLLAGRVRASAWCLLGTLQVAFIGSILIDGYPYYAGPHGLWVLIVASALLTEREWSIVILTVEILVVYFVVACFQYPALVQVTPALDPPIAYLIRNSPALFGAAGAAYLNRYLRIKKA